MDFLLEIILLLVANVVIEPLVLFIIDKVKKEKLSFEEATENIDMKNFTMKYSKDMKGLTWVLGCFLGIPMVGLLIGFPWIYKNNDYMSASDVAIFISTFAVFLFAIVYFLMRISLYRIKIVNGNQAYIHTIFKTKIISLAEIDGIKEARSGGQIAISTFVGSKKVWKVTNAFTNFKLAKELLLTLKRSK